VLNSSTSPSSVRLTFNEAIDPTTFDATDITGATGFSAGTTFSVNAVSGSGNKQFDVSFNTQTAVGGYSFKVGPNITDTAGNLMDQNQNGTNGESADAYTVNFSISSTSTTTFSSSGSALAIRDFNWTVSTINISQAINISDLNVKVNITHTYDSDLRIVLMAPDNSYIELSDYHGGSGHNYTNTVFDDQATTAISKGTAPFTGSYKPDQALSAFNGYSTKGNWSLYVYDGARYDTGTLNSWSMIVTGNSAASVQSFGAEEVAGNGPAATTTAPSSTARNIILASMLPAEASAQAALQSSQGTAPRQENAFNADVPLARREAADLVFSEMGGASEQSEAHGLADDVFFIDASEA
jgi:subtilisin-like proprotein convertase family protein